MQKKKKAIKIKRAIKMCLNDYLYTIIKNDCIIKHVSANFDYDFFLGFYKGHFFHHIFLNEKEMFYQILKYIQLTELEIKKLR